MHLIQSLLSRRKPGILIDIEEASVSATTVLTVVSAHFPNFSRFCVNEIYWRKWKWWQKVCPTIPTPHSWRTCVWCGDGENVVAGAIRASATTMLTNSSALFSIFLRFRANETGWRQKWRQKVCATIPITNKPYRRHAHGVGMVKM